MKAIRSSALILVMTSALCGCVFAPLCSTRPLAVVHADRTYNYVTEVKVAPYRVGAQGAWTDGPFKDMPPEGYESRGLMRIAEGLRRHRQARWFALTGVIGVCEVGARRAIIVEGPFDLSAYLRSDERWTPRHAGRLYLFANDVPFMYFNNAGHLDVTINLDSGPASPTPRP